MPQCPECRHHVGGLGKEGMCLRCEALPFTMVCNRGKGIIKPGGPVKSHGICLHCVDILTQEKTA